MEGSRINSVKRTLALLIESLNNDDKISLIAYQSHATIIFNTLKLTQENRKDILKAIESLVADGGTNIEDALNKLRDIEKPDSVFLLTDGQVNSGVLSRNGLLRIFHSVISYGTPVNTLGYGSDHNIHLLRDMAVNTCGSYTYAEAEELIPAIIGDIIGGLENTIGTCGKLYIPNNYECYEVAPTTNNCFPIGTIIKDKSQWIVLKSALNTPLPTEICFEYEVCGTIKQIKTNCFQTLNQIDVASQLNRCIVARIFNQVADYIEANNTTEALVRLKEIAKVLEASIAKDTPLSIQLQAQIDDMIEAIQTPVIRIQRQVGVSSPPVLAPLLSRLVSNTNALTTQRGFIYDESGITHAFSSPLQRLRSEDYATRYSQ
jgi:hypothetical protein